NKSSSILSLCIGQGRIVGDGNRCLCGNLCKCQIIGSQSVRSGTRIQGDIVYRDLGDINSYSDGLTLRKIRITAAECVRESICCGHAGSISCIGKLAGGRIDGYCTQCGRNGNCYCCRNDCLRNCNC